jgi:hypothetical protein
MSRPGLEPGPPAWEASTLEKSHLDSLYAGYSEPLLMMSLLHPDLYSRLFVCGFNRERYALIFSHFITFESTKKTDVLKSGKKTMCALLQVHIQRLQD